MNALADGVVFLSDEAVRSLLSVPEALATIEADFRRQAEPGAVVYGQPLAWSTDDRELGFRWRLKTVVVRGIPVAGVRVAGYKIDRDGLGGGGERDATRYIILSDPRTSSPLAIINEHSSFAMRTAGAVLVGAKHLARPQSRVFGVIGAGNVARAIVRGLPALFDVEQIRVMSQRPDSRQAFAAAMSAELGIDVIALDSYEGVCRGADAIFSATPSLSPFLKFDWLAEGVFVGVVGHDELEHDVFRRCDRFFVDYDYTNEPHPHHLQQAIAEGAVGPDDFAGKLWEVVAGVKPGRRDDRERVLVATVGLTSQDITLAYDLYERAKAQGIGLRLPF